MSDETINGMVETIEQLENELENYKWADLIVSCKDCKHHRLVSAAIGAYTTCEIHSGIWLDYDFCSKGEYKESEGE